MPQNQQKGRKTGKDPVETSVPAPLPLNPSLEVNLQEIGKRIGSSSDIVIRNFTNESLSSLSLTFIYIDGLVNADSVNQTVLQPLMENVTLKGDSITAEAAFSMIKDQMLPVGGVKEGKTLEVLLAMLFEGYTLILFEGLQVALAADTSGWEKRSINEPTSQGVIRGPKEGFTESLRTGTSMLRRRLKTTDLRIEEYKIGQRTQTGIAIIYLKGIASEQVLTEIRRRLDAINTDAILESNYIEEFIQDGGLTPFPTIQNTERPDAVAGGILEGQIGIIIDGTPFALLAPSTFFNFFQSSEDYYQRYDISSFLRLIRYGAFFVSMLLPALYIAVTTFHQEMLPTTLLISLAAQREGCRCPHWLRRCSWSSPSMCCAKRGAHAAHHRTGYLHRRRAGAGPGCRSGRACLGGYGYCGFFYGHLELCDSVTGDRQLHPADPLCNDVHRFNAWLVWHHVLHDGAPDSYGRTAFLRRSLSVSGSADDSALSEGYLHPRSAMEHDYASQDRSRQRNPQTRAEPEASAC